MMMQYFDSFVWWVERSSRWATKWIWFLSQLIWSRLLQPQSAAAVWSIWSPIRWDGGRSRNPTCSTNSQRNCHRRTETWSTICLSGWLIPAWSISGTIVNCLSMPQRCTLCSPWWDFIPVCRMRLGLHWSIPLQREMSPIQMLCQINRYSITFQ